MKADIWQRSYKQIYSANLIIEGASASTALTIKGRNQVLGEAYFLRAFLYFYLTNLYGDIPLVTTTGYEQNRTSPRQSKSAVLTQIASDLRQAKSMLPSVYADAYNNQTTARFRPNKWAATALLARLYLYQKEWSKAEEEASSVISQNSLYLLDQNLGNIFKPGSREAIWHIPPGANSSGQLLFTIDGYHFNVQYLKNLGLGPQSFGFDNSNYMNDSLATAFEPGDKRKTNWVDSLYAGNKKYFMPFKYKNNYITNTGSIEYFLMLRLAEQFLIRAEARLKQNNLTGAIEDINTIRARAGLPAATADSESQIIRAIEKERRIELFTEWGHRWFDLKRWPGIDDPAISRAEEIMRGLTPIKGGTWNTNWLLLPIPRNEILNGPNMQQNPGYN